MAPRHSRKVGLKRIDAAIDALREMGFEKPVIRKTVKKLLNVYEGDAGWVFIEEAGYKLLIETILEDQKNEQVKQLDICEGQGKTPLLSYPFSNEGDDVVGPSNFEHGPIERIDTEDHNEARDEFGACGQMLLLQGRNPSSPRGYIPQQNHESSPSYPEQRRRPPCYGWISESDEEIDEEEAKYIYYGDPNRPRKTRWDVKPSNL